MDLEKIIFCGKNFLGVLEFLPEEIVETLISERDFEILDIGFQEYLKSYFNHQLQSPYFKAKRDDYKPQLTVVY